MSEYKLYETFILVSVFIGTLLVGLAFIAVIDGGKILSFNVFHVFLVFILWLACFFIGDVFLKPLSEAEMVGDE